MTARRHLHVGVVTERTGTDLVYALQGRNMFGWLADGDSFLEWGERVNPELRVLNPFCRIDPVHLIYPLDGPQARIDRFLLKDAVAQVLFADERLIDYAVETDADDWEEDVVIHLADSTSSRVGPPG